MIVSSVRIVTYHHDMLLPPYFKGIKNWQQSPKSRPHSNFSASNWNLFWKQPGFNSLWKKKLFCSLKGLSFWNWNHRTTAKCKQVQPLGGLPACSKSPGSINMNDSDAAEMKCFDWGDSAGFLLSILNFQCFLRLLILRLMFFDSLFFFWDFFSFFF